MYTKHSKSSSKDHEQEDSPRPFLQDWKISTWHNYDSLNAPYCKEHSILYEAGKKIEIQFNYDKLTRELIINFKVPSDISKKLIPFIKQKLIPNCEFIIKDGHYNGYGKYVSPELVLKLHSMEPEYTILNSKSALFLLDPEVPAFEKKQFERNLNMNTFSIHNNNNGATGVYLQTKPGIRTLKEKTYIPLSKEIQSKINTSMIGEQLKPYLSEIIKSAKLPPIQPKILNQLQLLSEILIWLEQETNQGINFEDVYIDMCDSYGFHAKSDEVDRLLNEGQNAKAIALLKSNSIYQSIRNYLNACHYYHYLVAKEPLPPFLKPGNMDVNQLIVLFQSIPSDNPKYQTANFYLYNLHKSYPAQFKSLDEKVTLLQFACRSGKQELIDESFHSLCGSSPGIEQFLHKNIIGDEETLIKTGTYIRSLNQKNLLLDTELNNLKQDKTSNLSSLTTFFPKI